MKPTETVVLTEYVQACCPQQAIGEYTADAWHDLLGDLELADCKQAVAVVAKRKPFVDPSEIRAEVQRIRTERIARSMIPPPPPELCDRPRAYQRALTASLKRAADGCGEQVERLAITRAADDERVQLRAPESLRRAIGRFRRALPPRPATVPDEHQALEQSAESRTARGAEGAEEAS